MSFPSEKHREKKPKMAPKRKQKQKTKPQMVVPLDGDRAGGTDDDTMRTSALEALLEQEAQDVTVNTTMGTQNSESDEDSGLSGLDDNPLRDDIPVQKGRWSREEVSALMDAINVNRDALKFHFTGAGGGKEVKRQGWKDVTAYVNDVANTHRTVRQVEDKVSDYTQRSKEKYNKLRVLVGQTGRGAIAQNQRLSENQQKALDYIREEAVKGIPGISPMEVGGPSNPRPSEDNLALLWSKDRPNKPDYSKVDMKRTGVPKYWQKRKSNSEARRKKAERREDHKREMLAERLEEQREAERLKRQEHMNKEKNDKLRKAIKKKKAKEQALAAPPTVNMEESKGSLEQKEDDDYDSEEKRAERKRERALIRLQRAERRLRRKLDEIQTCEGDEYSIERKRLRAEIRSTREARRELK